MNPVVLPMAIPDPNPSPSPKPKPNPNPSTKNTYDRIRDTCCRIYWPTRISPPMAAYCPRTSLGM